MFVAVTLASGLLMSVEGCGSSTGFSTAPPSDTVATNAARSKIGIREIKPGWVFAYREFSEERWSESSAAGECKRVHRNDDGSIQWEEDYYPGPRTFVDAKGSTYRESLTVHYDYPSDQIGITYFGKDAAIHGLTSGLRVTSIGGIGGTNAETLDAADKILAAWKLKRL